MWEGGAAGRAKSLQLIVSATEHGFMEILLQATPNAVQLPVVIWAATAAVALVRQLYIYAHMYIYVHVYVYIYIWIYAHVYMYTCILVYVYDYL